MSQQRYCKTCRAYTLQDRSIENNHGPIPLSERIFLGVCTLGITVLIDEALGSKYWVCQVCGNKTER